MKATPSQNSRILQYLMKGKTLNPIQALEKFNCFRLAARISDLRADGFNIHTFIVNTGEKCFAQYSIIEDYRPL